MQQKNRVLELFGGSCSFSNLAKEFNMQTFTTDIEKFNNIDLQKDILDLEIKDLPFIPDIIWASPPCTFFSVASIGHHWHKDHTPKTKQAILGCEIVKKTLDLIKELQSYNNNLVYYIENPRGKLRKLDFMQGLNRKTIWYCQYGDDRAKPTDIWTNDNNFVEKQCFNGNKNCHHQSAPRGSKTGTQGLKNNYERSKVPYNLCKEILLSWQ